MRLSNERRFYVPDVVVCQEFSPAEAQRRIEAGDIPELALARQVELVDIDSGHWPMLTRPAELGRLLAGTAGSAAGA